MRNFMGGGYLSALWDRAAQLEIRRLAKRQGIAPGKPLPAEP
jgi:hypothetical protein